MNEVDAGPDRATPPSVAISEELEILSECMKLFRGT